MQKEQDHVKVMPKRLHLNGHTSYRFLQKSNGILHLYEKLLAVKWKGKWEGLLSPLMTRTCIFNVTKKK